MTSARQLSPIGTPQVGGFFRGTDGNVYVLEFAEDATPRCNYPDCGVDICSGFFFYRLEGKSFYCTDHFKVK